MNLKDTILAIDFDGTCVTHEYPEVGRDIGAVPVLRDAVEAGAKLILWTMRSDGREDGSNPLEDAVRWFANHNLPLYGVNRNPTQHTWTASPKAYAHVFIDDAGLGCPLITPSIWESEERPYVDWTAVRRLLGLGTSDTLGRPPEPEPKPEVEEQVETERKKPAATPGRSGARKFALIGGSELIEKINALFEKSNPEGYVAGDGFHILESFVDPRHLSATLARDLSKVQFDAENVSYNYVGPDALSAEFVGVHTLDNGLTFLGVQCGGDWEKSVYLILYWDGKEVRGYIPKQGNCWNYDIKAAIGNDEEADDRFIKKWLKEHAPEELEDYEEGDYDDYAERMYNADWMREDILGRLVKVS